MDCEFGAFFHIIIIIYGLLKQVLMLRAGMMFARNGLVLKDIPRTKFVGPDLGRGV